jgi:hypothetical protein
MPVIRTLALAISFVVGSLLAIDSAPAQIAIGISVNVAPPPLPVYVQPPIPSPGYIWVPGYWAWDDEVGYYWVPGTWVSPPRAGLLWTPGYWGWADDVYSFNVGYWGPTVGFYGGVAYGFGYTGVGFEGAYWQNGALFYNRSVSNFGNVSITNVYNKTVVNNVTNVSYNGGTGGTTATPTPAQLAAANEQHVAPTAAQAQHAQAAAKDPSLALNNNQGHPTVAATSNAGQFKGSDVVAAHPGRPVAAIQPQGHHVSTSTTPGTGTATTTPGGKTGAATTTPSTTTTGPKPSTATTAPGTKPGTSSATTTPGTGTATSTPGGGKSGTATTTTGNRPGTATPATTPKGVARGGASGRGPQPQVNQPPSTSTAAHAPSTAGHAPPPAVNKPPPPPRVAGPPPRPPGPPPHPPGGGGKPKCEPGQHC